MFLLILECTIISDIYMYSIQCHVHFVFVNTNYGSLFFRGDGSNLMNQNNSV